MQLYSQQLSFGLGASERGEGVYINIHDRAERACNTAENSSARSILPSSENLIISAQVQDSPLLRGERSTHGVRRVRGNSLSKFAYFLFGILGLSACTNFSPIKNDPLAQYTLSDPAKSVAVTAKKSHNALLVALPTASPGYQTSAMMYMRRSGQLEAFARHRWVASPPLMLAPLIEQRLAKTEFFKAVVLPPYAGSVDYTLVTQVLEFYQSFQEKPSAIHLNLYCVLLDNHTAEVVMTRGFAVTVPVKGTSIPASVQASNQAIEHVLDELTRVTLSVIPL